MIVVADAVAAIATAIAIWLMSCARVGRPLFGIEVNVTGGIILSSFVIRGDLRGCLGSKSSAGMLWAGLRWMVGTSPGVFCCVCLQCVRGLFIRFRLAVGSRACMMAGLSVTL